MGQFLLLLVVALVAAAVVFGVVTLIGDGRQGLSAAEPDGRAAPLPGSRPLNEGDLAEVRFDTAMRGYRMAQVDRAVRRAAYDLGYKQELITVLEAEVAALRDGRQEDADELLRARLGALVVTGPPGPAGTESAAGDAGSRQPNDLAVADSTAADESAGTEGSANPDEAANQVADESDTDREKVDSEK